MSTSNSFDMPSLSERLQALGVEIGIADLPKTRPPQRNPFPIAGVLPGNWWHTTQGEAYCVETVYQADFQIGAVKIFPTAPFTIIGEWAKIPALDTIPIENFVFLDTETTGLSGSAGTYTFLIGAGKFERDQFRLVQFFLTDPGEEIAQLAAFEAFLSSCEVVVNFNGKAFDVPLINSRYTFHRWSSPLSNTPQIDLLHLARRLWKSRLTSRSLGDLEWHILNAKRSDKDVPGWMIPDLYLDYLHTGDARPLRSVFYHNEIDVLSMAALLNQMSLMVEDPFDSRIIHSQDVAAIGKLYADLGYHEDAIKIFQHALKIETTQNENYWDVVNKLSFIHKKLGDLQAAQKFWLLAADQGHIYAHEELAKHLEHSKRDYHAALGWTEGALKLISQRDIPPYKKTILEDSFKHREVRLKRKIKRSAQKRKNDHISASTDQKPSS